MSREVMTHVFASQNELGCLCDEAVYQNDIALRLEAAGLGPVAKEVPVIVSVTVLGCGGLEVGANPVTTGTAA